MSLLLLLRPTAAAVPVVPVPTGLTATPISASRVDLTWTGVAPFDIERDGVVIVTDHPTASYSDTGLAGSTTYTYRVRAVRHR